MYPQQNIENIMNKVTQHIEKHFILCYTINNLWQHNGNKKSDRPNLPDNVSTTDILCEITHTNLFKIDFLETSGSKENPEITRYSRFNTWKSRKFLAISPDLLTPISNIQQPQGGRKGCSIP